MDSSDDGICRLHASGKGDVINRLMQMHGFKPEEVVSIGDSEMDLSMMVPNSGFIGFNPSRESFSMLHRSRCSNRDG